MALLKIISTRLLATRIGEKLLSDIRDDQGATTLEWCMLLGMVVLPAWVIIRYGLLTLAGHYGLVTTINQMPFP